MLQELYDEISAIDAIYEGSVEEVAPQIYNLQPPDHPGMRIQMSFPAEYPEVPPDVLQVIAHDPRTYTDVNYLEGKVREHLRTVYHEGEVCLFDLFAEMEEFLAAYVKEHRQKEMEKEAEKELEKEVREKEKAQLKREDETKEKSRRVLPENELSDPTSGWIQSEPIVDRGSTFIAYARHVESVEEAEGHIGVLVTDKRISRATHNISSWRIRRNDGIQFQDCDDDGETAAGGRLLHLLTMMDVWNVVVVVSRWFGGTHLGPDRFKHINSAARDAVVKGEFIQSDQAKKKRG